MRGADAIIDALKQEGVQFVAGYPGGGAMDIVDALIDAPEIKSILVRHERVAADMADGYARATGKPGVVMVSQGAGGAHAVGGIAQSYADCAPVLLLCGTVSRRVMGTQSVQEIDNMEIFRTITKWEAHINLTERIPELMRRAFTALRGGRLGPVMLEIPTDVAAESIDGEKLRYHPVGTSLIRCGGDPKDIERAADWLAAAKNPLLYVGAGALYSDAADEVKTLAELLSLPVTTTLNGKSVFPEDHPLSLGLGGYPKAIFGTKPALQFARKADLVLAIGNSFKPTATGNLPILSGVKLIHVNVDPLELNKIYRADLPILGDAKLVLQGLIEAVLDRVPEDQRGLKEAVVKGIKEAKEGWLNEWMPRLTADEVPISPYRLTWDIMKAVDRENTILLHDSGNSRGHVSHHYEALFPRGYLGMGGESEMGWSLGAALGAKLGRPDKLVINVIGDGAFAMTGMDLETAVRHQIPILTIVANNYLLGITQLYQKRPHMVELGGDYTMVAKGLGAHAERVEKPDGIVPAIKRAVKAMESGRPALLEVIVKNEALPTLP